MYSWTKRDFIIKVKKEPCNQDERLPTLASKWIEFIQTNKIIGQFFTLTRFFSLLLFCPSSHRNYMIGLQTSKGIHVPGSTICNIEFINLENKVI